MYYLHRNFSHIYIEESALTHPNTEGILAKFPQATRIIINCYKEIFNRPKQDWRHQKESLKLILALRTNSFYYEGSPAAPSFGHKNFFYNSLVMNCIYDCHYCYLQGLYPSANMVMFVNNEDFISHTEALLKIRSPLYLCISYDTDLLALEGIFPYCREWIKFAARHPDLSVEIRTKSANFGAIRDLPPLDNVILAWTVSPGTIIERYETKTPPLGSRLASIKAAIEAGWSIRLCFDPILSIEDWQLAYTELVDLIFAELPAKMIRDASLGVFRMNPELYRRVKKQRADSDLFSLPYQINDQMITYADDAKQQLLEHVATLIGRHLPSEKVYSHYGGF